MPGIARQRYRPCTDAGSNITSSLIDDPANVLTRQPPDIRRISKQTFLFGYNFFNAGGQFFPLFFRK